jgi:hypothetical protein
MYMTKSPYSEIIYYTRNGGAYDRGAADSYYSRPRQPHYFKGFTHIGVKVEEGDMSDDEVSAYHAGYDDNEEAGNKKEWR